jgi:predicted Zn-dependent peptidase
MSAMINSYLQEVPVSTIVSPEELERRIGLITPQRLNGLARKYFDERELIRMVMYPAAWGRE